jgi:hypothetical protein
MKNYVVVNVLMDYDYCEGVDFVADFDSYEEANQFIIDEKNEATKKYVEYIRYVDDYVDKIVIPEKFLGKWGPEIWKEWEKFIDEFYVSRGVSLDRLKENLKISFRLGSGFRGKKRDDFNPPPRGLSRNLFVISRNV